MGKNRYRVPGADEPDPENRRLRPLQGGATGLTQPATMDQTYGQMRYADGEGPAAAKRLPNGTGSGLSGLPEATAGMVPPLYAEPASQDAPGENST